jgi:hypothetical protein
MKTGGNTMKSLLKIACLIFFSLPAWLFAQNYGRQNSNFLHPIGDIEKRLKYEDFEIFRFRDSRFEGDITNRAILKFLDGTYVQVKWKRAPIGGETFNNQPRYELAAYEFQTLFLDQEDYVVPPTAIKALPYSQYKNIEKEAGRTFKNPDMVFFALQYWLENVDSKNVFDKKRMETDTRYATCIGNMNIFSYLVRHSDANEGNFLISTITENPRVFAVDNGVAFESQESNRGYEWRKLRVDRLPAKTIDRLKKLTPAKIKQKLETVAQFEIQYGLAVPVAPTENLNPSKGVRRSDNIIQFGLTKNEIDGIVDRLNSLLKRVEEGKIEVF